MLQDNKKKKVLLTRPIDQAGMELLEAIPWIEIVQLDLLNENERDVIWEHVNAIIARAYHIDAKIIQNATQLEIIAQHGVGLDYIDVEAATKAGIYVTNAPQTNTVSVAEFTITLLLMLSKKLISGLELQKTGQFYRKDQCMGEDIEGKVLGLIGFGNIGKKVAELAYGMGMQVVAYDPYVSEKTFEKFRTIRIENLEDIFPMADYISLHMPGVEAFKGMINARQLNLMKSTAYLINCARGILIDEDDLASALMDRKIAGAAIDVTCVEPLPEDSILWKTPNLYITPHMAAITKESLARMSVTAVKNVIAALGGEKPENLVNTEIWEKRIPNFKKGNI